MRIALISQEYPPETAKGGIGTQTYLKAHGLTAMGHDVRVISRSPGLEKTELEEGGVRVIRVPSTPMPVYTELADWLSYSQRVAEEIAVQHAQQPFDILDFPEWACEGYVHLLNQSEWNRIPSVIHLHGPLILQNMLQKEVSDGWSEFSCHPGYITPDYRAVYREEREYEVHTLTDPRIRQTIQELGIVLSSYANNRRLQTE